MASMLRSLLPLALLAAAAAACAEDAISLYSRHKAYYCNRKDVSVKTRAVQPSGEMVLSSGGDLMTEFVREVYNKLAELKDTPAALRILPGLRAWAERRARRVQELEAACAKECESLEKAIATLDQAGDIPRTELRRWLDLETKAAKMERCDLAALLEGLAAAARGSGAASTALTRRWLLELEGFFSRLRDADRWTALQLDWVQRQVTLAEQDLKAHPEFAWRRGLEDLPGAEGLMVRRRDFAALQRIVEDQVLLERVDTVEFGRPETEDSVRSLTPGLRPAWRKLIELLGDARPAVELLKRSLMTPYDQLYVEHQLFKYAVVGAAGEIGWLAPLAASLRNWARLHEDAWDGEDGRRGLLEALHFRQGCVHTAHVAGNRFIPPMMEDLEGLQGDPSEAARDAQGRVHRILSGMRYGGTASLAESFEKKTADCFRDTEMAATLLANAGWDGLYPLMWRTDGNGHLINAMRLDGRIVTWDCYMSSGGRRAEFPRDFRGYPAHHVALWYRALDTWIEADILLVREDRIVRHPIPYYGRTGETVDAAAEAE